MLKTDNKSLSWRNAGLFSNFLSALDYLKVCKVKGYTPVIDWGEFSQSGPRNYYYEKEYGENVWEYYFEPVLKVENTHPISSANRRDYAAILIKEYIRFKPHVMEKVDDFYERNMASKHILGVHMRGTDRRDDPFVRKCSPDFNFYAKQIDHYLQQFPDATIFVATDAAPLLNQAIFMYGKRIIYYDAIRSANNKDGVHNGVNASPYQKGEDAAVECLLLSRCQFLIRSISNLSMVSLFLNPSLRQVNVAQINYGVFFEDFIPQAFLNPADRLSQSLRRPDWYLWRSQVRVRNFIKRFTLART